MFHSEVLSRIPRRQVGLQFAEAATHIRPLPLESVASNRNWTVRRKGHTLRRVDRAVEKLNIANPDIQMGVRERRVKLGGDVTNTTA